MTFLSQNVIPSIFRLIKGRGSISVAEYMKYCLTNPIDGYYSKNLRSDFGIKKDFITSPEISQIFGEILGVWIINDWLTNFNSRKFEFVELGPGNGSLFLDLQRVFSKFSEIENIYTYKMIDLSPILQVLQQKNLSQFSNVQWYYSLSELPMNSNIFCFIANEFFDALPITKFKRIDGKWYEILICLNKNGTKLSYTLCPTPTNIPEFFFQEKPDKEEVELNIEAGHIINIICQKLTTNGGLAIICDYGHLGEKGDTLRAFKDHKLVDPLEFPCLSDLTADVDFKYLTSIISSFNAKLLSTNQGKSLNNIPQIEIIGPISQSQFLLENGAQLRLEMLLQNCRDAKLSAELIKNFQVLIDPKEMGERFKFLILKCVL